MIKQEHLQVSPDDVGRYVLLPGDPARCDRIAAYFDNPVQVAYNREFKTITGTLLGAKVSVVSTGVGNPSAAIAIEELYKCGVTTLIRVGTSGGMQPHALPGDLAIIKGSIRDEGTTKHYMPVEFPAVAHLDVVLALRSAAKTLGFRYHVGISHSKDSYFGQVEPERMPVAAHLQERWLAWVRGGTICAEMESATLLTLGAIHRLRTGSITLIAINQDRPELGVITNVEPMISTAILAIENLIREDRKKSKENNDVSS